MPSNETRPEKAPGDGAHRRVLVVGDSISYGHHATMPERAYPALVAAALGAAVTVLAAPGLRTGEALALLRWHESLTPADLVLVELGSNDCDYPPAVPPDSFAADYRGLLALLARHEPDAMCACLTTWPVRDGTHALGYSPMAYDAIIRAEAAALRPRPAPVVELAGVWGDAALRGPAGRATFDGPSDGGHPNDAGHAALARAVLSAVT